MHRGGKQEGERVVAGRSGGGDHFGVLVQVGRRRGGGEEVDLAEGGDQCIPVGGRPGEVRRTQCLGQGLRRLVSGRGVGDDLRQQRVVVGRHDRPGTHAAVDPHRIVDVERQDLSDGGHPAGSGVLGDEPRLDGVSCDLDTRLAERQRLARRHPQLELDEVEAGDHLGDRMLHLEPGVDLEEVDDALLPHQELDRAGVDVAHPVGEGEGAVPQRLAGLGRDPRRRRLLDDLLVAALDGAFPLTEVDDGPVGVADDLHLDVPAPLDVRLGENRPVSEGARRLPRRRLHRLGQLGRVAHHPHATPPTACCGLHQGGHRNAVGDRTGGDVEDGGGGHPRLDGDPLRGNLVAEQRDLIGTGPHPDQPGLDDPPGEFGVLGEEAVAGVNGVTARCGRRCDDGVDVQVRLRRRGATEGDGEVDRVDVERAGVGLGVDADRVDAHPAGGAGDAAGDLAPVGDEEAANRCPVHQCRHTP